MEPSKTDVDRIGNYAAMLLADQNIDRRTCRRIVPLEVLSLGYSRTGTMSMQNALQILGYPTTYHFSSLYGNIKDSKYEGIGIFGRAEFDQLLGHVGAVTDAPCTCFAAELVDAYPEAKVVLVEREIEAWYRSWDSLVTGAFDPMLKIFEWTDPMWFGRIQAVGLTWMRNQVGAKNLVEARANARDMYREYYAEVRRVTPKERLLEYKLGSGWEPLCEFLGKEVPKVPLPHVNESSSLKIVFEEMGKKAMRNTLWNLGMLGAVAVGGGAVWWAVK